MSEMPCTLKVAVPQLAPCWLDRKAGIAKLVATIEAAAQENAQLIAFSEAFLPGYPFWVSLTDGAIFNNQMQKQLFAHYSDQAIKIEAGHLQPICTALKSARMAAYLGIIERAEDRSTHSLYCSYVYINPKGEINSVQRKLQPTYEERLVWASGDGAGLVTHRLGEFCVGGLNCWENWMPLTRTALYAQGEDLHVAGWPGSVHNTEDISRFIAKEGRSYVVSISAIMRADDVNADMPYSNEIRTAITNNPSIIANGGSCVAAPDGSWVLEPKADEENLRFCTLDPAFVRRERQNFDPTGHYSRPDITHLTVNRRRQSVVKFE